MPISYSLDAFRRIDAISGIFRNISKLHGYTSIIPGSVSSFSDLASYYPEAVQASIKYTGPDGNIYTVKSDPTHFVTKFASQNKRTGHSIQKYAYLTSKLNWTSSDSRSAENLQCGLEIYDSDSLLSEAEAIRIACKILAQSGVDKIIIDLGNINFTEAILEQTGATPDQRVQLKTLIDTKNLPQLEALIAEYDLDENSRINLMQLPQLFGSPLETIEKAQRLKLSDSASKAIKKTKDLYEILSDYGIDTNTLKIDFSFTNSYSYYTDTIYKIYTAESGQVLASGGRYDNAFGYGLSACGIALYLNEINEVIEMKQQKNTSYYSKDFAIYYESKDRKNAFKLSDLLRDLGYVVSTSEENALPKNLSDAEEVLTIQGSTLDIVNQRMNTFSRSTYEQFIRKVENQYAPASIH